MQQGSRREPIERLNELHLSLYENALAEAKALPGISSSSLIEYSEQFQKSLPPQFELTSLDEVLAEIRQCKFLLFGDFHSHRQCQKGLLRILAAHIDIFPDRPIVLFTEMVSQSNQMYLDAYMNGDIVDQEFLNLIQYESSWGFPWRNYRMVLDFCRTNRISVRGANLPEGGRAPLVERDRFAAKAMYECHRNNPEALLVYLVGEFHLAENALPKHLRRLTNSKDGKLVRIFCNVDKYRTVTASLHLEHPTGYMKLSKHMFCVQNAPLWMKWQSYVLWEELRNEMVIDDDDDFESYTEDILDLESRFHSILKRLVELLGIDLPPLELSRFNMVMLKDSDRPQDKDRDVIHEIQRHGFAVVGETVYLTGTSLNKLSESVGQYLWHRLFGTASFGVGKYILGLLSSKIFNPKRKIGAFPMISWGEDTPFDRYLDVYEQCLSSLRSGQPVDYSIHPEILRLAAAKYAEDTYCMLAEGTIEVGSLLRLPTLSDCLPSRMPEDLAS